MRIPALRVELSPALLALLLAAGCGSSGSKLDRSCAGKTVPNCLPYEYSVVTEASLEPAEISVGDPMPVAMVRVVMQTCGEDAPQPHVVAIRARVERMSGLPDGGIADSVLDLAEVRDDGSTGGDPVARDGVIEATIPNPFNLEVPPERDLMLRFEPRAPADCSSGMCIGGTCRGEAIEIPYRTGPRFMPPMP